MGLPQAPNGSSAKAQALVHSIPLLPAYSSGGPQLIFALGWITFSFDLLSRTCITNEQTKIIFAFSLFTKHLPVKSSQILLSSHFLGVTFHLALFGVLPPAGGAVLSPEDESQSLASKDPSLFMPRL